MKTMMDTPLLREQYRDLLRDAIELSGKSVDASSFKTMCEAEMIYMGEEPSPKSWVIAAEKVIEFLKCQNLDEEDVVFYEKERE